MDKFFQILGYLFLGLVLMAVGALGFWYYQNNLAGQIFDQSVVEKVEEEMITPGPSTESTVSQITPTIEPKNDLELITQVLAAKYNKDPEEAEVSIEENTGVYANGGIRFQGEISGAWWLAYKEAGEWLIVADGNGTVPCEAIEPYNFPVDMVPECWRQSDSTLVQRGRP